MERIQIIRTTNFLKGLPVKGFSKSLRSQIIDLLIDLEPQFKLIQDAHSTMSKTIFSGVEDDYRKYQELQEQLANTKDSIKRENLIEKILGMESVRDLESEFQTKVKEFNLESIDFKFATLLDRKSFADECIKANVNINFADLIDYPIFK